MADNASSKDEAKAIRKRATAAAAKASKKRKQDDDENIDENGRKWLNVFLLFLILGAPILTAVVYGVELLANSLSLSPRDKLEAFYAQHNPEKLKDKYFLDKTLRKWRGREDLLFEILGRKYAKEEED